MKTLIEMAKEAGFTEGELSFMTTMFERFAEIVRADEREVRSVRWDEYIAKAIAAEREACAKVCEATPKIRAYGNNHALQDECAAAIRARSNT